MTILDRIDNTLREACPCGADPRPGSPYCSYDCEPTHRGRDTDTRQSGDYATPMRWRPDLVTAADDTDLIRLNADRPGYTGPHNATVYERASDPTVWHLRLDDGHRYVGCDITGMADRVITADQVDRIVTAWQRLERELSNSRHLEPDDEPQYNVEFYPTRWQHLPGYTLRRHCRHCNQHVTTRHGMRAVMDTRPAAYLATLNDIRDHATSLEPCDLCGNCRRPFPGPPVYVTLQRDHWTHTIRVRLKADGYGPVEVELPLLDGDMNTLAERIQQAADQLEVRLFETLETQSVPAEFTYTMTREMEDALRRFDEAVFGPPAPPMNLAGWRAHIAADIESRIMDPRALFRTNVT